MASRGQKALFSGWETMEASWRHSCARERNVSASIAPSLPNKSSMGQTDVPTRPAPAAYEKGVAAYEKGVYATALRLLRPLAEQGEASAQYTGSCSTTARARRCLKRGPTILTRCCGGNPTASPRLCDGTRS
jgi:isopenicillin N synthase-like dioxygenase